MRGWHQCSQCGVEFLGQYCDDDPTHGCTGAYLGGYDLSMELCPVCTPERWTKEAGPATFREVLEKSHPFIDGWWE